MFSYVYAQNKWYKSDNFIDVKMWIINDINLIIINDIKLLI